MPLLGGLLPGPPPLDSLEALGWRGILWLGPSRPPRSASAGPPPRAPPPLFLPEGRRAQASAARQRPGGSAGKLGALTLQPALGRPLMQEARQASFWTWSWKCFLLVGSLSPLCSTDIQDHRPRDWTPLRLHRAATLSCRARLHSFLQDLLFQVLHMYIFCAPTIQSHSSCPQCSMPFHMLCVCDSL